VIDRPDRHTPLMFEPSYCCPIQVADGPIVGLETVAKANNMHRRRRDSGPISDLPWRSSLISLLLIKNGAASVLHNNSLSPSAGNPETKTMMLSFDLHPTAVLALHRRRTLSSRNNSRELFSEEESDWFHPNSNAIYATMPKRDAMDEEENQADEHLVDFHRYRHLSRYERHYRLQSGLDLQPDWDGIYDFFQDKQEFLNNSATINAKTTTNLSRILRQGSSSHTGGRFDNYQAVSLSQGYGTHYANVWVGSPTPQRKTLIVDTGSHYTGKFGRRSAVA
jgi:hypothetical protein